MKQNEGKGLLGRIPAILNILFISIIIYANALSNGFVNDDDATVANNALIKDIGNLPKLFEKEYFTLSGENSYRPFVTVTYFLDYSLFGLSPLGFHLTNILLHALNAIFLYLFLTLFIGASNNKTALGINTTPPSVLSSFADHFQGRPYRLLSFKPLFITLLFVTHPALTETVNAISFREDLLVFLFYMATLNLYIIIRSDFQMRRSPLLYAISCLTYSFALLSKEMAATLPLIVYCYEWIYKNRTKGLFPILINPYNIGYIAITSVYIYIRFYYFHNPVIVNIPEWSIMERILTVPWLLLSYVKLILFPISLSAYYEFIPLKALLILPFILSFTVLLCFFFMALDSGKEILFGIVFFVVTLTPVYNIIPIINPFAERYIYLPTVGIVVVTGVYICFILSTVRTKYKNISLLIPALYFLILCLFIVLAVNRNGAWKDTYSLWSDVARKVPKSNRAHYNLGTISNNMGRVDEAISHYQAALATDPDDPKVHNNLANIYSRQGQYSLAILHYQLAIKQNHSDPKIYFNLGTTYGNQGKFSEAAQAFQAALKLDPNNPNVHNSLGLAFKDQNRLDDAIQEFQTSLSLQPEYEEAHYNLGNVYLKKGLTDKAKEEFETTLILRPDFLPAKQVLESFRK